jgi:outer membrane protein assembly factor BamB
MTTSEERSTAPKNDKPRFQSMNFQRLLTISLVVPVAAAAAEWSHIAGPSYDRKSAEKVPANLAVAKPRTVWEISTGGGFSSFVTGNGKAYTIVPVDARETAIAVDRKTGKTLWKTPMGSTGYRNGGEKGAPGNEGVDGPRSTPVYAQNRVFVFGGKFDLYALDSDTGRVLWKRELIKEFGGQEIVWSNAASPLVVGDRVLVAGGGAGQAFISFRADNGEVQWKSGSDEPTHSTPTLATIHGQQQAIFLVKRGLVSLDPATGRELWHYPFPHRTSTAASPVVWNDIVNCAAAYQVGGAACQVKRTGDKWETVELWRSPGNDTSAHWTTAVVHDGYLYGLYGHRDFEKNSMKCIDIRTGKILWEKPGFGPSQVLMAGDRLLATTDFGDVVVVEPNPQAYREISRLKGITGKVWASPALSDGQLLLRSTSKGVCLDLGAAGARTSSL